jgi:hypothetical protein
MVSDFLGGQHGDSFFVFGFVVSSFFGVGGSGVLSVVVRSAKSISVSVIFIS